MIAAIAVDRAEARKASHWAETFSPQRAAARAPIDQRHRLRLDLARRTRHALVTINSTAV